MAKRFSNVHQNVKQINIKTPKNFSGKMQFTGRTIKFICNYLINNICQLNNINSENIGYISTEILKILYWNSFNEYRALSNFKYETISKFKQDYKINIIPEKYIKDEYKQLLNTIKKINNYLKNIKSNDFLFSFELFVKNCEKIEIKDIDSIVNKLEILLQLKKKKKKKFQKIYFIIL